MSVWGYGANTRDCRRRVGYLVIHIQGGASGRGLGLVDFVLGGCTVCLILLGQMKIRQNWHICRARWWNAQNSSQPNPVHDQMNHPVLIQHRQIDGPFDVTLVTVIGSVEAVEVDSSMAGRPAGPTDDLHAASSPEVISCQERSRGAASPAAFRV